MATPRRQIPLTLEIQLAEIARQYRRRAKLKGWLKLGTAFVLLLILVGAMTVVGVIRPHGIVWLLGLLGLLLAGWEIWVRRALSRKPTHEQLALFLDEHHPELENLAISSVEFSREDYAAAPDWMLAQFFQDARLKTRGLSFKTLVEGVQLNRLSLGVASIWLVGIIVLLLSLFRLDFTRPDSTSFSVSAIPFEVSPGDIRLRKGADLVVWVTTDDADAGKTMRWRVAGGDWQTTSLQANRSEADQADGTRDERLYYARVANLQTDTDYQVEVGRRRSRVYRATVWEPPEVEAIHLTYHFPDYLELPQREAPYGGHITAPEGSTVDVEVEVSKPLAGAMLVLQNDDQIVLEERSTSVWAGQLHVNQNDAYHIELTDHEGEENQYQPEYRIVAQEDRPPEIRIHFPRGDDEATSIEEIPFAFDVKDDYGLRGYGLQYEIAGREPVRLSLASLGSDATEATAERTVALEKLGLSAGDFVIWSVWAEDRKPGRASFEMLGDPYFLEIRPFDRSFREAISNQGGEQPQAQMQNAGTPQRQAADQKQVIIATWNLRRQARGLEQDEYDERLTTIIEAQREVLQTALQGEPTPEIQRGLVEAVGAALAALEKAKLPEPEALLSEAIRHQQRAHAYLLRMQPEQTEVMQARMAPGAVNQSASQQRDLDALELTQRRDFREEASTLREQQAETEAARNRIEELAKRQRLINEDMARLISEMETTQGEQREQARRQLEQLQEEQQRAMQELDRVRGEIASRDLDPQQARDATRQLEEARQQMDRSARNLSEDQLQQARGAGNRALGSLSEAGQELQNLSRQAAAQRMAQLREQMDQIQQREQQIMDSVRQQSEGNELPRPRRLDDVADERSELQAQKEQLAQQFETMMEDASELAEKSAETQARMARELGDWLRETAREGIYEDIQRGDDYIRREAWDLALDHEQRVNDKLAEAAGELDGIAELLVEDDLQGMQRALEELEDLMQAGQSSTAEAQNEGREGAQELGRAGGEEGSPEPLNSLTPRSTTRSPQPATGDGRGGPFGGDVWTPEELRRFADGGYRDWVDRIRNAEDLLPQDSPIRERLGGVREDLDAMRRRFLRDSPPPRYDLVFDRVIQPLTLAAEDLKRAIREQQSEFVFGPESEGEVPAQYKTRVAQYFKRLSEME